MTIVFTLVAATLLPDRILAEKFNLALGREAALSMQAVLEQLNKDQRGAMMNSRPKLFIEENIIDGWILTDDAGLPLGFRYTQELPDKLNDDFVKRQNFDVISRFKASDGENLVLYARINSHLLGPSVDLWRIFAVMAVGTIMLLVVLYTLMLRLIVKPLERLAAVGVSPAIARGLLPLVPTSERHDEIGELVRAYNKMAGEVNDLRLNLEKRVQQATQNLEHAQQQIVVSERLNAAGRMAAGVAHEVNNPLGGMINAARTLRARAAPGRDSEYLDLILDGLSRVQGIVAGMLQFSRPAQQSSSLDLREVIDGALMFCRYRIQNASVTVAKNYDSQPSNNAPRFNLVANRAELGQVFLNLIVNALDAMEVKTAGAHTLTLNLERANISIVARGGDSGTGMKPDVKERAGQFFFSTKGEGKGTGLGLAVVQHIVVQHRGTVTIESTEGVGTTVTITLPAE